MDAGLFGKLMVVQPPPTSGSGGKSKRLLLGRSWVRRGSRRREKVKKWI